ncbi:MAG: histidine kinase, partial [Pseudonocardia sp.]|nr:histidine kinase [Pseudonocardia sp.]
MTGGRATLALSSGMLVAATLWVIAYLLAADGDGVVVLALLAPAVLVAAGVAGRWGSRHTLWVPAVVPAVAAMVVLLATGGLDSATAAFVGLGILLWSPWLVGRWLRARAALGQAGWQAAARWEDQAREAEDDARRRERARLAARMHDLVGHDLARAALTLGGLELDTALPAQAQRAVAHAREQVSTAAEHLSEAVTAIDAAPTATPAGAELDELVTGLRSDGSDVALVPADPAPLLGGTDPTIADLVVRVVREGLTNAIKHGGDGPIEVSLARWAAQIVVVVRSRGANQRPAPGSGRGLAALRQDVDGLGGTLEHGRSHDDYLLAVRMPIHH